MRERLVGCALRILRDRHEAEDVVQEALLRARGRPLGQVYATCYRLALDRLRARRRHARALARVARDEAFDEDVPERQDDAERVRAALDELPDPYRSALELRYLEELPFDEVARRLNALERTTRTWVARGLARLREALR